MLILFNDTDAYEIALTDASVVPLPFSGSWRHVNSTDRYDCRALGGGTNGVTAVEMLGGDGDGNAKVIDYLSVLNPNAANETVIITHRLSGTAREVLRVTLAQYERLQYQDGAGWQVFASTGALKTSMNQGANAVASGDSVVVLAADVPNANAVANSIADVTGLQFPVVAGQRYGFEFFIRYFAALATTGSRWSINGPAFDELVYGSEYSLTAATVSINSGLAVYDLPAASNVSSASTGANWAYISGIIRPTANGNVIARFASEIASSAITAKAGSYVRSRAL